MLGYNILCALGAIVAGLLCGGGLEISGKESLFITSFFPLFYVLFFVGFLPSYWAVQRYLQERIHLIIVNVAAIAGVVVTMASLPGVPLIGASAFIMINLIDLLLWLGLFFFSIWCGTTDTKH